jgi:hypothetical protein
MGLKRIELVAKLIDEDTDEVQATQKTVWHGLDGAQVLFVEKHLLQAYVGMNSEAAGFLAE